MSSKFSLLTNAMPTFTKKTTVEAKVDALTDYQVQLLDYLRYALSNLDADNFNPSGLNEILEPVVAEVKNTEGDILSLWMTAEELAVKIEGVDENYTTLQSEIKQTSDKVSVIVSAVDDSSGNVTAASIVAAINSAGSTVKINADHIVLSGVVTVSDLNTNGAVEINAGNIKAGGTIEGVALKGVTLETVTQDSSLGNLRIENAGITFGGALIERFVDGWGRVSFRVISQDHMMLGGFSSLYLVPPGGGYWSVTSTGFYKYNDYGQIEGYIAMSQA